MSHAKQAFELMRETNRTEARKKAQLLEKQNIKRREITDKLVKEIEKIVEDEHNDKSFILITGKDYPVGIVGIIAGQIAQKYQKPTGIFTKLENECRGSFRSVEGVHIVDALDACSEHLEKYGGHEQAAGAVIKNENFTKFCTIANEYMAKQIGNKIIEPSITIDYKLDIKDVDIELAKQLQRLEPYGEGNPEPLFVLRNLTVQEIRTIGLDEKHLKMKLSDKASDVMYDAIAFGRGYMTKFVEAGDDIDIAAHIQENEWMGNVTVQFNIVDLKKK